MATASSFDPKLFHDFEQAGWNSTADKYDRSLGSVTRAFSESLLDAAGVQKGTRVLDVATGPGYVAGAAATRGAEAIGLDFAPNMVAEARRLHPHVMFQEGDAEALLFPGESFDAVVISFGMLHVSRPELALAEVRRVLRPGGRLAFTVWGNPHGLAAALDRGTLFLDHVDELGAWNQPHLLVILASRSVHRIGSTRAEPADVWILTSAYGDLKVAIHEGRFREDLYQHLGELDLLIPPLRQRPDDILLLAEHFLARGCAEHHLPPKAFAPDTRRALLAYSWPGNVREVEHLIKRVASQFAENDIITPLCSRCRIGNERWPTSANSSLTIARTVP